MQAMDIDGLLSGIDMTYYYSPSQKGFYTDAIKYAAFPKDAIKLSDDMHQRLLSEVNKGHKEISVIDNELVIVDKPIVTSWKSIRSKRDILLKNSDYTQMPDYPGDRNAYAIYRQALRDIPQKFDTPDQVVWPVDPKDNTVNMMQDK